MLRIATATIVLVVASASGVAGQGEEPSPSASAFPAAESTTPATTWVDEQTCIDPDFLMPRSSSGTTVSDLFNCARSLGLKEGDPDYDACDFSLMKRTVAEERYTEQCDDAGDHIGSRYHASGTDRLYNHDKPERVAEGTFDFSVVSTLLDPDEDIWQVERQGSSGTSTAPTRTSGGRGRSTSPWSPRVLPRTHRSTVPELSSTTSFGHSATT